MKLVMFKRAKPRGFQYKPRYFDPAKEAREERKREVLGADYQKAYQDDGQEKDYVPGQFVRSGGIRRTSPRISSRLADKKHKTSSLRWIIALLLLVALGAWMYMGRG